MPGLFNFSHSHLPSFVILKNPYSIIILNQWESNPWISLRRIQAVQLPLIMTSKLNIMYFLLDSLPTNKVIKVSIKEYGKTCFIESGGGNGPAIPQQPALKGQVLIPA